MIWSSLLACTALVSGLASAAPAVKRTQSGQNAVYWGQDSSENNDLSTYCTSTAGIDILILAFLYEFGTDSAIPSGTIGDSCYISTSGQGQNCDALAAAIQTCQSVGVKIILSLGGASAAYQLTSNSQAAQIGNYLWESYGNSGNTQVQRPFGNVFVNGFDFDIEQPDSSQYFPAMINALRQNFPSDPSNKYYITGAPQCPIPEPNMGIIIGNATFDYLFVQFYNNNDYAPDPCALPINGNAPFNYNQWVQYTAGGPSANAEIFIGVPAAPDAANGDASGATYYATPAQLAGIVNEYKTATRFGGVMMWAAGYSDHNVNNGCTYAQDVHAILVSGQPCGGSPITTTRTTSPITSPTKTTTQTKPTTKPTTATTTGGSSAPTGGSGTPVGPYDQCGGSGYTGSTTCVSGYYCYEISSSWSQCDPNGSN